MKNKLKKILYVVSIIVILIIIDLVCIFTINRPLFAIKEGNEDSVNIIYRGLLYDTYNCHEYSIPQIKTKGTKFSCSYLIKKYQLNNSSRNFEIEAYIEEKEEKTNIIIKNIIRENNNEQIIIKDINAELYMGNKIISKYEKTNIDMIVAEGENPDDWEALVELDKTLNKIII